MIYVVQREAVWELIQSEVKQEKIRGYPEILNAHQDF